MVAILLRELKWPVKEALFSLKNGLHRGGKDENTHAHTRQKTATSKNHVTVTVGKNVGRKANVRKCKKKTRRQVKPAIKKGS